MADEPRGHPYETPQRRRVERAFVNASDTQLAILLALEELEIKSPRAYSVFVLKEIHGMSVAQIALYLQIERDAVHQNLSRARRRLRRMLVGYEEIRNWLRATRRLTGHGSADTSIAPPDSSAP